MKQLFATIIWRCAIAIAVAVSVLSLLTIPASIVMVYWNQGLLASMRVAGVFLGLVAFAAGGASLFEWARRNRKR